MEAMMQDIFSTRAKSVIPGNGQTFAGQLSRRAGVAVWLAGCATGWLVTLAIVYSLIKTLH